MPKVTGYQVSAPARFISPITRQHDNPPPSSAPALGVTWHDRLRHAPAPRLLINDVGVGPCRFHYDYRSEDYRPETSVALYRSGRTYACRRGHTGPLFRHRIPAGLLGSNDRVRFSFDLRAEFATGTAEVMLHLNRTTACSIRPVSGAFRRVTLEILCQNACATQTLLIPDPDFTTPPAPRTVFWPIDAADWEVALAVNASSEVTLVSVENLELMLEPGA